MESYHEKAVRRLSAATALKALALVVFALVVFRHAWVGDDAFITLRSARNLVEGQGPRWNLHERVQSFTHPLWMFVLALSYWLTQEPMVAALLPALGFSLATVYLIAFRLRLPAPAAILAIAALVSCKSFVDYSTSGLENPLSHFLFVLLVAEHLRGREPVGQDVESESRRTALRVTLLAGLLALNRLDTILLSLPFLLVAYWRMHDTFRGAGKTLAIGFAPFLAWEVFAIVYYGFPFPCTAYSKLGSGVALSDLRAQGALYFLSQLTFDPTSLLVIAGALVLLLVQRERRLYPLGLGIVLYLAYVVRIGGDFMAGRFFTLPLLASALLLALLLREYLARKGAAVYLPAAATIAAGLLLTSHPTLGAQVDYALVTNSFSKNVWDERGVADERAVYAESSSILRVRRDVAIPDDGRRADGQAATAGSIPVLGRIGVSGFFAPPNGIIVDGDGLADALVARLPLVDKKHWRIGHFWRHIPDGYIDSIKQGRNLITDPATAILYDRVKLVVSGPIWSWARWKEIARLNFGLHRPSPAQPDKRS